ncbi:hypothetical protein E5S67_06355 [Microcoleus sp. IPMA8]|uniref:Transposase n=1 Tax=Microcoleus asticus IPMA8 TaxID=2563858 RepID=A0ABX2DAF4_9CYAN|nr:hypothetical protein [Microcoleus asticus IPMA8]
MLDGLVNSQQISFAQVLMDSWYAYQKLIAKLTVWEIFTIADRKRIV